MNENDRTVENEEPEEIHKVEVDHPIEGKPAEEPVAQPPVQEHGEDPKADQVDKPEEEPKETQQECLIQIDHPIDKPVGVPDEEPEKDSRLHETPRPNHVLPPEKYKLKALLLFSDFFAIIIYVYFLMIKCIVTDVKTDNFAFTSNRMFAFYCVIAITVALLVFVLIFKMTKSASTRFERANLVREDPNIKVWLAGYDWGWPILFLPTMVLMWLQVLIFQ